MKHTTRSLSATARAKARRSAPLVSLVRTIDLRHAYGKHVVLNGVSLDVREGEILGILGPNGSGKSTLLKVLTTSLLPSGGEALVAGESVVTRPNRVREHIGVVFQSFGLDKKLTVIENLESQGHLYALQGEILAERIASLLASFGLLERQNDLVGVLSGGLQRRVEIAKGVLHHPKVLFLDEPSTGLDPAARRDLWHFLEMCRTRERTTILLTTHLAEEAERCDRITIMDEGALVVSGTPDELKEEIGGDVIVVQSMNVHALRKKILRLYKREARVVGNELLLEWQQGHRFIPTLVKSFPELISSVTIRKPTLEDVFVRKTGHALLQEERRER